MDNNEHIEALYHEYEKYILPTIYRKFPNYKKFASTHGLDMDDIIQFGRIGLYKACKTYDAKKRVTMRTYAIQQIVWTIMIEVKKNSLHNVSNKSLCLVDKISFEQEFNIDGEAVFVHETIGKYDNGYSEIEFYNLVEKLKGKVPDNYLIALDMRRKGYTHSEIGKKLGVSAQRSSNLLQTYHKILKELMIE